MELRFKIAEINDTDKLLEFMRELYEYDHIAFDESLARSTLTQFLQDHALGYAWLIHLDEQKIGYVVLTLGYSLEWHGRDAFVDEFYIRENFRAQGWGKKVIEFIAGFCREQGVQALHLEVQPENSRAYRFYQKAGFVDYQRFLMTKRIGDSPTAP